MLLVVNKKPPMLLVVDPVDFFKNSPEKKSGVNFRHANISVREKLKCGGGVLGDFDFQSLREVNPRVLHELHCNATQ